MNCIYGVTEIYRATEGHCYLERMNEHGEVVPLFADGIAHIAIENERFTIANGDGEAFFIGKMTADSHIKLDKLLTYDFIEFDGALFRNYEDARKNWAPPEEEQAVIISDEEAFGDDCGNVG